MPYLAATRSAFGVPSGLTPRLIFMSCIAIAISTFLSEVTPLTPSRVRGFGRGVCDGRPRRLPDLLMRRPATPFPERLGVFRGFGVLVVAFVCFTILLLTAKRRSCHARALLRFTAYMAVAKFQRIMIWKGNFLAAAPFTHFNACTAKV